MEMAEMFSVMHGQCTKEFIDQMRTCLEYELANDESNVISLVEIFQKICYQHDCKINKPNAILYSVKTLINCLKHNSSHIDCFKKMRE